MWTRTRRVVRFYAQVDYADVDGNTPIGPAGTPPRGDGQAWKVGASWGYMPGARVGLIWVKTRITTRSPRRRPRLNGFIPGNKVNQQTLDWEHTFGNFQVMAQYGQLGDIKGCASAPVAGTAWVDCGDSKAIGWSVSGRYFLSKRTWLFASWNLVDNKSNQFADYNGGAITSTNATAGNNPFGADPQIWALGIFHNF